MRTTGWSKLNALPMEKHIPEFPRLAQPSLHIALLPVHCSLWTEHRPQCECVKSPSSDPSPLMRGWGKNLDKYIVVKGRNSKWLCSTLQNIKMWRFYLEFKYLPVVQLNPLWKRPSHMQLNWLVSVCRWAMNSCLSNAPIISGLNPCQWILSLLHTLEATLVRHFNLQSEIPSPLAESILNHGCSAGQEDTNAALPVASPLQRIRISWSCYKNLFLHNAPALLFSITPLRFLKCRHFRYFVITMVFYHPLTIPGLVIKTFADYKRKAI